MNEPMNCPYCRSSNIKKAGFLKSGKQRWMCNDCKHNFNKNTIVKEEIKETCPHCHGKLIKCGFTRKGKQQYKCKSCGKKILFDPEVRPKHYHGVDCPHCNSKEVKKSGFTKDKRQLYVCMSCKYKFTLENKFNHVSKENKKIIILYGVKAGAISTKNLAESIGCCEKTVRNIKKKYLDKVKEINNFREENKIRKYKRYISKKNKE